MFVGVEVRTLSAEFLRKKDIKATNVDGKIANQEKGRRCCQQARTPKVAGLKYPSVFHCSWKGSSFVLMVFLSLLASTDEAS